MYRCRGWIWVLILFCSFVELQAQSYITTIKKISVEDGLSNRFVRRVFQDSRGFIWMATKYGLNRYDGYNFKLFTKENQGLASNSIYEVYEDGASNLWISYFDARGNYLNDIDILDAEKSTIVSFDEKYGKDIGIKSEDIFDIYQVSSKSIFVLTRDKKVFEFAEGKTAKLLFTLPYATHTLQDIVVADDLIWVVCQGVILEYDRFGNLQSGTDIPYNAIMDLYIDEGELSGFARDGNNQLIVFSKKYKKDIETKALPLFEKGLIFSNIVSRIKLAPNGLIWYNDQSIAKVLNERGEVIYDFSDKMPIQGIYSVYFDNNNSLWITTPDGVYLLTITPNRFYNYLKKQDFDTSRLNPTYSTRGIVEDHEGNIYVNTYSGRRFINIQEGGTVYPANLSEKNPEVGVLKDRKGYIWFCGDSKTIERFDPLSKQYKEYTYSTVNQKKDGYLSCMVLHEDHKNRIWLGTSEGLYYFDSENEVFIKFIVYGTAARLNSSKIYSICEDKSRDMLWIGASTGIYGYNYNTQRFQYYYHIDASPAFQIPHDYILSLHKDDKQKDLFWIGTKGGGLLQWNPYDANNTVKARFTVASGLSDNVIYAIQEDDYGYLWMSSDYGLMRFNKETNWTNTYLPKDGLTHEEFNTFSSYKAKDGRMYFGGMNGLNAFYPKDFQTQIISDIPLHIIDMQQMNGSTGKIENKTEDLLATQQITLQPNDNFFSLQMALLDYSDSENNRYAYKIDGIDKDWHFTNTNEIRFNQMPAGKYTLTIKGQGANGIWSKNRLEIPILIHTPFYKTFYFFALIILAFGLGVYVYFKIRVRLLEQQRQTLETEIANRTKELVVAKEDAEKSSQAKAEFLSVMSHEIRTPMNAVVNITNFLLQDEPKENQIENLNILKFSADNLLAIINDVLDFNKIESGKVTFEKIEFDMLRLIDSIKYSMEANAKARNISFETICHPTLKKMLIGDPSRLTQVLNNLISNALKFTEKGKVSLVISPITETEKEIRLLFEIKDTGIGIAKNKQQHIFEMFTQASTDTTRKFGGTGLGLAISQKLITMQNSKIEVESQLGKGATFKFELLFKKGNKTQPKNTVTKGVNLDESTLKDTHILVVEDNIVNVMVVKKFLQKWGVKITRAADGVEAVEAIQNHQFDLVLMDIHMPNMDGYEASSTIRKLEGDYYQKVPIIALTASALADDRQKVFEHGMDDIVVKPFIPAELYEVINKYIKKFNQPI